MTIESPERDRGRGRGETEMTHERRNELMRLSPDGLRQVYADRLHRAYALERAFFNGHRYELWQRVWRLSDHFRNQLDLISLALFVGQEAERRAQDERWSEALRKSGVVA